MRHLFILIPVMLISACGGDRKTPPPRRARRVAPETKPVAPPPTAPAPAPKKETPPAVPGADAGSLAPVTCPPRSAHRKTDSEEGCLAEGVDGRLVRTGRWKTYHPGGNLRTHREYRMGKRHGAWKAWSANGTPEIALSYADGRLHGDAIVYSSVDGKLHQPVQARYEHGEPVSLSLTRLDGKPALSLEVYDDATVLTVSAPDGDGRAIASLRKGRITFVEGDLASLVRWLDAGMLARWVRGHRLLPRWLAPERSEGAKGFVLTLRAGDRVRTYPAPVDEARLGDDLKAALLDGGNGLDLGGLDEGDLATSDPSRLVKDLIEYLPNELLTHARAYFPTDGE